MFEKTRVVTKDLTPELAAEWCALRELKVDRELKDARLNFLIDKIRSATFHGVDWSEAVERATGNRWRANGQHSSHVLTHLSDDLTFPVGPGGRPLLATISTWTFDSMEEDGMALFDQFDNPQSARTNLDYLGGSKVAYEEIAGLPTTFVAHLVNGIDLYEASLPEGSHVKSRYRGDHFLRDDDVRQFVLWANGFSTARNAHFLARAGVVAEAYADFKADPRLAGVFWHDLLTEGNPDPDHETRELGRVLNDWISKPRVKTDAFRARINRVWKRYHRLAVVERDQAAVPAPVEASPEA